MADLPTYRVQPSQPFLHKGIDYGGPFVIKESRRRNAICSKAYLSLFNYKSTKAVHLKIVSDLAMEAFLAVLDRFVSRRGILTNSYSDYETIRSGSTN